MPGFLSPTKLILLLATLAVGLGLAGLDAIDFVRQSECRTAVVAREMLDSRDFLVPTVNGRPRFEKPPLYYWAIAGLAQLAGGEVSEAIARLPSLLSALAAALLLGGFAWRRAPALGQPPAAAGWLAGLMLICLPGFWQRATLADAESMLALACLAVSLCLYEHLHRPRPGLLVWAYGISAVAFLVKGPVFLLFTWPAYLWLARRHLKENARWHGLGLLLFLLGAASWYVLVQWHDPHALAVFRSELAMRFDSKEATHPQPFWFYLPQLLESSLPLGLFLPVALYAAWKRRGEPAEAFLLGNVALGFAALTLLKTKQAHYLLPLLPWLALWLGDLAWTAWPGKAWRWLAKGWLTLGGALAWVAVLLAYSYGTPWLVPVCLLLLAGALAALRRAEDYPWAMLLLWSAALVVGAYAANEAVFKPLRGLKFEHGSYFSALRAVAAEQGLALGFDDACFYYYYGLPAQRAASPAQARGATAFLSADGSPAGMLHNHHRSRQEWLWQPAASPATSQLLLSSDGKGLVPGPGLAKQSAWQSACLSAELWRGGEAALLKASINGACRPQTLLPDLLAANNLLQGQLSPWKGLWLEAHDAPPGRLHGRLLRFLLSRWVESSDAAIVWDRSSWLEQSGKHGGAPLLFTVQQEPAGSRWQANGEVLERIAPDGETRRWQRQTDAARLVLRP